MERSLTVLLPVHNVQATLALTVLEILDVVADLTAQFELIIIDDGSRDATSEVAQELTRRYPQVHAICRGQPQGREAAIRAGLERSAGELVFLRNAADGGGAEGLRRLWHTLQQEGVVATSHSARGGVGPSRRIPRPVGHKAGYQLIARYGIDNRCSSRPSPPNYLLRPKELVRHR